MEVNHFTGSSAVTIVSPTRQLEQLKLKGILKKSSSLTPAHEERTKGRERWISCVDLSRATSLLRGISWEREKRERPRSFPGSGLSSLALPPGEREKKNNKKCWFPANVVMQTAIMEGDLAEIKQLVAEFGPEIANERDPTGLAPVIRCVFEGQTAALAVLAKAGANFSSADENNWTALHVAATLGDMESAKIILDHSPTSALILARNDEGERAIHLAESPVMVQFLLKADLDCLRASDGGGPATKSEREELEIVQHVMSHLGKGGCFSELDKVVQTGTCHHSLLHLAAGRNYERLATFLLAHDCCHVNERDGQGNTALSTAVLQGNTEVARILVQFGAVPS